MKRSELPALHASLSQAARTTTGKLGYAIAKNVNILASELKLLEEMRKPAEDYEAYEKERVELCKKMCVKDDKGQPRLKMNSQTGQQEYDIENKTAWEAEFKLVQEKHAAAIKTYEAKMEGFTKVMESEADIELYRIKQPVFEAEQAELPAADKLKADMLVRIWPIIDEDDAPAAKAGKLAFVPSKQ